MNWPRPRLSEGLADVVRGVTFSRGDAFTESRPDAVPVLRAGNIGDRLITEADLVWVPSKFVSRDQRLRPNDIVICTSSGSRSIVGKSAINEGGFDGTWGAFNAVVRTKAPLKPRFMFYWMQSADFKNWRDRSATGANIQNIRHSSLESLNVPLPAPSEQSRIVEVLDQADTLRRLRRAADAKAARILPALFLKMFGDPATNPMGWRVKRLGDVDVCDINPHGARGLDDNLRVSFVPMADVDERLGRIVGDQTRTVREVKKGFTPFRDRDVLFAKITPCMQNGKAAIASGLANGIGYGSTEFHVLRPASGVAAEWVFALVRLESFREQARAAFTGSAGQQRVPANFLKQFRVPVPDPGAMTKFAQAARATMQLCRGAEPAADKLDTLFSNLLRRAFSGQLTAAWRQSRMQELLAEMQEQARLLNLPLPQSASSAMMGP